MNEYKYKEFNFIPIVSWIILFLYFHGKFVATERLLRENRWPTGSEIPQSFIEGFLENSYFLIPTLIFALLISINVITFNRREITKEFFFIPITFKRKSWNEIKLYADVDEFYRISRAGSIGYYDMLFKRLWIIDKNDRVFVRLKRKSTTDLQKFLDLTKRVEKLEIKNHYSSLYFRTKGWLKVIYPNQKPKPPF
jgi:hypothetical protein